FHVTCRFRYPSLIEKLQLAKNIIIAFPQLKNLRYVTESPEESLFFWKNGGKGSGDAHTGLIENRANNMRKDVPKDERKYRKHIKEPDVPVDEDIIETAQICAALTANAENIKRISDMMKHSFVYHQRLLNSKSTANIIEVFPHIHNFNGTMLNPSADISGTFRKCLLLEEGIFSEVEDRSRMATKCTTSVTTSVNNLFIRTVEKGKYVVEVSPKKFIKVDRSSTALDMLLKSFVVLGLRVPASLAKLYDFACIVTYKTLLHSSRNKVNRLCTMLSEMDNENDNSE
ncbi:uncharacterized protein LOC131434004, partial [Malaya genurostris]|uniref:uncharacterized protein LOC131434004 n=1 Tax=Malaya genurostris TaxID=325434 RepID=UPI0026F39F47